MPDTPDTTLPNPSLPPPAAQGPTQWPGPLPFNPSQPGGGVAALTGRQPRIPYTKTADIPGNKGRSAYDKMGDDPILEGMRKLPPNTWMQAPGYPQMQDVPDIIHGLVMGPGRYASPGVANPILQAGLGMQFITKDYIAGARAMLGLRREQLQYHLEQAAENLDGQLRDYREIFQLYGPKYKNGKIISGNAEQFRDRLWEAAGKHGDTTLQNYLVQGDIRRAEDYLSWLGDNGNDLKKANQLLDYRKKQLEIEKLERGERNPYEKDPSEQSAVTPPSPAAPGGTRVAPTAPSTPPEDDTDTDTTTAPPAEPAIPPSPAPTAPATPPDTAPRAAATPPARATAVPARPAPPPPDSAAGGGRTPAVEANAAPLDPFAPIARDRTGFENLNDRGLAAADAYAGGAEIGSGEREQPARAAGNLMLGKIQKIMADNPDLKGQPLLNRIRSISDAFGQRVYRMATYQEGIPTSGWGNRLAYPTGIMATAAQRINRDWAPWKAALVDQYRATPAGRAGKMFMQTQTIQEMPALINNIIRDAEEINRNHPEMSTPGAWFDASYRRLHGNRAGDEAWIKLYNSVAQFVTQEAGVQAGAFRVADFKAIMERSAQNLTPQLIVGALQSEVTAMNTKYKGNDNQYRDLTTFNGTKWGHMPLYSQQTRDNFETIVNLDPSNMTTTLDASKIPSDLKGYVTARPADAVRYGHLGSDRVYQSRDGKWHYLR